MREVSALPGRSLPAGFRARLARSIAVAAFGVAPVALVLLFSLGAIGKTFAWDFQTFWLAGRHVAHGVSPYPPVGDMTGAKSAALGTSAPWNKAGGFVFPAPAAIAMVPFGLLPFYVAASLFMLIVIASMGGTLWTLGVRDWRCYGATFAAVPVLGGLRLGAWSAVLALLLALAWKHRSRAWIPALAIAAAIVLKLFLWPLLAWLAATRRATFLRAVLVTAASTVAGWAMLRFAGLAEYTRLVERFARTRWERSYAITALGHALRLSYADARAVTLVAAAIGVAAILVAARLRGDRAAFALGVGVSLLVVPTLWLHYLSILFVGIAVRRPTFGPLWLVPLLLWAAPYEESGASGWRILFVLAVVALVTGATARGVGDRAPKPERTNPARRRSVEGAVA